MSAETKKILLCCGRAIATAAALAACAYLLYRYEYFRYAAAVDNVVGALPAVFALIGAGALIALLWLKYNRKTAATAITLALLLTGCAALFPTALRGEWWLNARVSSETPAGPNLKEYAPFAAGSKVALLDGPSSLRLSGDLPVLDGATALYPVYSAFVRAVYDESAFNEDTAVCTNTVGAYRALIQGKRDMILAAGPSKAQLAEAEDAGVKLNFTPVGKEAFVFLAGNRNPVENLEYSQIRNVYSGKTAYWKTLGWKEGGKIIAFQRPEGSGSQTGLQRIMGDLPIISPQPLPHPSLIGSNSLMQQVGLTYKGVQPALGYSYRYYAVSMYANPEVKLLSVNGAAPNAENIRSGVYPFVSDFFAVTRGAPQGNVKKLLDFILSPQGQQLIEKTGYTPLTS